MRTLTKYDKRWPCALRVLVFAAMDNAVENGYGEMMRTALVAEVADDLLACDYGIASMARAPMSLDLAPHIEAWRLKQ